MSLTQPEQRPPASGRAATTSPVILAAVDGGPAGEQILDTAARLAFRTGARVVVAHVQPLWSVGTVDGEALVDLRRDLEMDVLVQATSAFDYLRVNWTLDVVPGEPATAIQQLAEKHDAALLIVGCCGKGFRLALRRLFRRSVSKHLIRHEHRPVLVVPTATAGVLQPSVRTRT